MIEIAVQDDGHGVLAEQPERIFDPGYRAPGAAANGRPLTGRRTGTGALPAASPAESAVM